MNRSQETTNEFNKAASNDPAPCDGFPRQVSKQRIEELTQSLSQPLIRYEPTPFGGVVAREYRPEKDREILKEIAEIRAILDRSRNNVLDDFHQAHDGYKGENLEHNESAKRGLRR